MPYYFSLPSPEQLTLNQQDAVDQSTPLALSGGPGTGKSVVSLWRHINNHINGKSSLLLTYTITLEHYLAATARTFSVSAADNVNRTLWWTTHIKDHHTEIIVDEAQDVHIDRYEKIQSCCNELSYGADERQSLFLTPPEVTDLMQWFNNNYPRNYPIDLKKNFRNSKEILLFVKWLIPSIRIPQNIIDNSPSSGLKPIMRVTGWNDREKNELDYIVGIINNFHNANTNIGILVPFISLVETYANRISKALPNLSISSYHNEMPSFNTLSNIHVTTFKSSKGLEFDIVILPRFDGINKFIAEFDVVEENDYYVACTRAKRRLYMIGYKNPKAPNNSIYEVK